MPDGPADLPAGNPANHESRPDPTIWDPEVETLDEAECRRLIAPGGVGRLAYSSRLGEEAVVPVHYNVDEGSIVFRAALGSLTDEDLRTGIRGAEYRVGFEVDNVGKDAPEGWVVLIQGDAHHMDYEDDRVSAREPGSQHSEGGPPEHFLRITPTSITGRRRRWG